MTGRYTYNASKVITNYLKPLATKKIIIIDKLKFLKLLKKTVIGDCYKAIYSPVEITTYNQFDRQICLWCFESCNKLFTTFCKKEFTIWDTLKFPELLKKAVIGNCYKDIPYHVESLFNSVPVRKTTVYNLKHIYIDEELKPFARNPVLKNY